MEIELRYDPLALIMSRGGPANVLAVLDEAGLLVTSLAREHLLALISHQRPDGGFPSKWDATQYGVQETERAVRLLLHSGLGPDTLNVAAALQRLLQSQRPDGGWSENPALKLPSTAQALSTTVGVTWLTAEVVQTIQEAGTDELAEPYWRALDWLYRWHCAEGGWPSLEGQDQPDPDSSSLITFLLEDIYGENNPVVQQGRLYYEHCLTRIAKDAQQRCYQVRGERCGLDVYHLVDTVLEPQAAAAGYDINDERVTQIVEAVVDILDGMAAGARSGWKKAMPPTRPIQYAPSFG